MATVTVNGVDFQLDEADLWLVERGNLHIRRGGRNRGHHRYLYWRSGGRREPEYSIARLILGLPHGDRSVQADHINRDTTDNRRFNLRAVTPKENQANRGRHVRDGRFAREVAA